MTDISILHLIYEQTAKKAQERLENGKTSKKFKSMEEGLKRLFEAYGGYCNPNDLELRNNISKIDVGESINLDGLQIMHGYERSHMSSLVPKKRSFKLRLFLREIKVIEDCVSGKKIRELDELARALYELENNYIAVAKDGSLNFADQYAIYARIQDVQRLLVFTAKLRGKEVPFYRSTPPDETAEALKSMHLDIHQIIETHKKYNKDKELKMYADELRKEVVVYRSKRIDNILQLLNNARSLIRMNDYEMELSNFEKINTSSSSEASEEILEIDENPELEKESAVTPIPNIVEVPIEDNNISRRVCSIDIFGFVSEGLVTSWNENDSFIYVLETDNSSFDDSLFRDFNSYTELMFARENSSLAIGDVTINPAKNRRGFKVAEFPFEFYYLEKDNGDFESCETDERKLVMVSSKKNQVQQIVTVQYASGGSLTIYEYGDADAFKKLSPQASYQIGIDNETLIYKKRLFTGKQYDLIITMKKMPDRDNLYSYQKIISGDSYVDKGHTSKIEDILFEKDKDIAHGSR